jgi:hypothetical protein
MRKLKMTNDFEHDWNDLSLFEKLPVHKTAGKTRRDDWKRERKALRKAKHQRQYGLLNSHTA